MAKHGRESRRVGLDAVEHIALELATARDAERLAKIRSGKLRVDPELAEAIAIEDREAMRQWDPYEDGMRDKGPRRG